MANTYINDIKQRINYRNDEVGILLAYANYPNPSTQVFAQAFFPFAITASFPPHYPHQYLKHERRASVVRHVDDVMAVVRKLRENSRQMKDALSGNNFSPLTLPLRNFQSNVLTNALADLFRNLGGSQNPKGDIDVAKQRILNRHPHQRILAGKDIRPRDRQKPYYADDRDLRFKSPGSAEHGWAQGEIGHNPLCLLNSRVRLGGPLRPKFHYDCDFENREIRGQFPDCHDNHAVPSKRTHVNIAPSDYFR